MTLYTSLTLGVFLSVIYNHFVQCFSASVQVEHTDRIHFEPEHSLSDNHLFRSCLAPSST